MAASHKVKESHPGWLKEQLAEYQTYTSLTLLLVAKRTNEVFMGKFYERFFELSPQSVVKFKDLKQQYKAVAGALQSVVKLIAKPKKMQATLASVAKVHRRMDITSQEYSLFGAALRDTFRSELGTDYTEKMDSVWKQFLELLVLCLRDTHEKKRRSCMDLCPSAVASECGKQSR